MSKLSQPALIGVDWGSSHCRGYLLDQKGSVIEQRQSDLGASHLKSADQFQIALWTQFGDWIDNRKRPARLILSGMVGSAEAWRDAGYLDCPIQPRRLGRHLVSVTSAGLEAWLVPGLSCRSPTGSRDVMRGEETQLAGLPTDRHRSDSLVCLPGTHTKWVWMEGGRIQHFMTYLSGEAFALLKEHSILGRSLSDGRHSPQGFARGIERSSQPGGLMHHVFGLRALSLLEGLSGYEASSYLSGILIGHEVRAVMALKACAEVTLVGSSHLNALYGQALEQLGSNCQRVDGDEAASRGLAQLAIEASMLQVDLARGRKASNEEVGGER